VEYLHLGPFATEPASFQKMWDFCRKESLARVGKTHREIYLSDPRKSAPEKLKTILRFPVRDDYSCV
jgi:arabinogalactan oligomer/maltooligosaccharide transport system substrate-binding protein